MTDEPITRAERQRARQNGEFATSEHRSLPSSLEAERGVLCSILLSPDDVMSICQEKGVKSAWFHAPAHALLYSALVVMWQDAIPVDVVTVTKALHDGGQLAEVGGVETILNLQSFLPTAANVEYYIEALQEKMTLREVIRVGTEYVRRGYDEAHDPATLLDSFEQAALGIRVGRVASRLTDSRAAVAAALDEIQQQIDRKGVIPGLETGFPELDKLTGGLHPQEFVVIAARPSLGKTALAMNIVEHAALICGAPVAVFSLEMSTGQLAQRLLCSRAAVNLERVRNGLVSAEDQQRLAEAAHDIGSARIYFDDTAGLSIQEAKARVRRLKQKHGIAAVFFDYLQLLTSQTRRKHEDRQREVAEISAGLKWMAKEFEIPVIALAQLSRGYDERSARGGRPRLSDLRDSGAIEQDADTVCFIVRDEMTVEDDEQRAALAGVAELIIAKQRSGPLGTVPLTFLKEFTRFEPRAVPYDEADRQQSLIDVPATKPPRKRRAGDE